MICPGGSVDLDGLAICEPDCVTMNLVAEIVEPAMQALASANVNPSSVPCGPFKTPMTATVTLSPDAAPGTFTVRLKGQIVDGGAIACENQAFATVTIGDYVDLDLDAVADDLEINPGGFLCVNDDDDNINGIPDKDEPGPTVGEDDLVPLTVSLSGGGSGAGTVTLSCEAGCGRVRFYENPDRANPVTLPLMWSVPTPELPATFYVEGYDRSVTPRDVELKALYAGDGGPCEDHVKLTVVELELSVDVIDQDDPTNTAWSALAEGSPVYGGSEASTADNLRLTVVPGAGTVADITWTTEGLGGGTWTAPPSGPTATQWDMGDILNPIPGEVTFRARVTYDDGRTECGNFETEIGVRTDDVIVVGWINREGVTLPTGADPFWTGIFLPDGPPVTSSSNCNWTIAELSECDITPLGQDVTNSQTAASDRSYILSWLFKYANNADPTSVIPGGDFRDSTDMHIEEAEVTAFKGTLTNFKLFSRYQIKYVDLDWCGSAQPPVLKASALIGTTVNPCGPTTIPPASALYPGQIGPMNQPPTIDCVPNARVYVINDGSPDSAAVSAFDTLKGQAPVSGQAVFWENIGSQIKFRPDGNMNPTIVVQPYPTYYIYRNGKLVSTIPQASTPLANFGPNPYPFGTVPCSTLLGTTPGGRCGIATTPPDLTARVPDYVAP